MRFKVRRQVMYAKKKRHSSSRLKHDLKGKHKIYHTIKGKGVSGIYYKGRFYSRKHHLKKGHRIHHTVRHKGVDWHAVSSKVASSVGSAWNYVKRKRNDWKESRARKKYYKDNLSAAEREQVKKDLERKNPYAVKGPRDDSESVRAAKQRKYDAEEKLPATDHQVGIFEKDKADYRLKKTSEGWESVPNKNKGRYFLQKDLND